MFRDTMIHDFDMTLWLPGPVPATVTAVGSTIIDTAVVPLQFANGRIAVVKNSRRTVCG